MVTNCPKCGGTSLTRQKYTWWGGFIGPKIINVTKCDFCGNTFNGNTGKSNTTAIIIYVFAVMAITIAVVVAMVN